MTGLSEDAHDAVERYEREAGHAVHRIHELGTDVAVLVTRLAPGGPLGDTADPDLTRARQHLARAAARIAAAGSAAATAAEPARDYLRRAFPR